MKIIVIQATFNQTITDALWEGVQQACKALDLPTKCLIHRQVPGSFEIPVMLKQIFTVDFETPKLIGGSIIGAVALGCVIRGDTPHFDYVCTQTTKGIQQVSLEHNLPVAFGILTTDNFEQAIKRAGRNRSNKGYEAMMSLAKMAL